MAGKVIICLLRNDLRIHDNEALLWAFKHGSQVLPIYCFDPRHFKGTYHFGFAKTGPHRLKFMIESVEDLRCRLKHKGSGLIVRTGKPEEVIPELIKSVGQESVSSLVYTQEVTQEELDVEAALNKTCGVKIQTFWNSTLFHKDDLSFSIKQLPDVFSQFRKRAETECSVRSVIPTPETLKPLPQGIEEGSIPTCEELGFQTVPQDDRTAFPYCGGETSGLDRIKYYFWESDKVAKYKETRNGMIGADYSTKFAPWLAHGCLSPRFIYSEIKRYEKERTSNQSTYWVIFELLWRDYFRFVAMKYGNEMFFLDGIRRMHLPWKRDTNAFNALKEGRTGVPYVDANMRELATTGFMSNRGRQNVASFLTKDLKLDWRLGAEWFESMLIDHDVCSNYGNWQYSAGIGNDPRQDRKFNMVKQGLDYDPNGDYIRLWIPELNQVKGGDVHTVWALNSTVLSRANVVLAQTYPKPLVIAPEWGRHMGKVGGATRGGGKGRGGQQQPTKRGMDFYFKNTQPRQ